MKRKNLMLVIVFALVLILFGVSFAVVVGDYFKAGDINNQLVVGDIYMHYKELNTLTLENAIPSTTYDPTKYFEFTIDGKNTSKSKDIIYDIVLNHGDDHGSRSERIDDIFLKFTLMKKVGNGEFETVVDAKSYPELTSTRIWKDTIDAETNTDVTHTYRLYMWISNDVVIGVGDNVDYNQDVWNNQVYASIKVTVTGDFQDKRLYTTSDKIVRAAKQREQDGSNCKTYIEEDGITYISGSSECIDFNYLWYSGRLWRITAIYPDGAMKLVTENTVTNMSFDSSGSVNFYTDENNNSDIYKYLNNDFYNTLITPENVIDTTKSWNATMTSGSTKPSETTMISSNIAKVGLINSYEYFLSYKNLGTYSNSSAYGNGYLRLSSKNWWLLNPDSSSFARFVSSDGSLVSIIPSGLTPSVRPSIYLKSDITLTGNGTKENSYKIKGFVEDEASLVYKIKYKQETTTCKTYVQEDGITYISGTKKCIDFNYVWWSGKMWRITAIYPDGAMKMVTDNMITSIAFNEEGNITYYDKSTEAKSYMFQWLNEDFLDTLYNNGTDVIDTTKSWNATMPADTNIETKPLETDATMILTTTSPVGLLNSYEYYKSYQNTTDGNGYLNIGYRWWLLNPYNSSSVRYVYSGGSGYYGSPTDAGGARPSVYLKSGISLSGSGTKDNPYRLAYDYDEADTNDLLNTRHSGEYVKLSNNGSEQLFRIVDIENNKTKIVAMDYAASGATKTFSTYSPSSNYIDTDTLWGNGTTTYSNTWYTYLNSTYYSELVSTYGELFDSATYYLGTSGYNYKLSVCANTTSGNTKVCDKTSQTGTFNIGLLRYGEMFATQQGKGYSNSIDMWLINRYSASSVWCVDDNGYGNSKDPIGASGARPSIYLKSTVKILSGSGTELDPYIVG